MIESLEIAQYYNRLCHPFSAQYICATFVYGFCYCLYDLIALNVFFTYKKRYRAHFLNIFLLTVNGVIVHNESQHTWNPHSTEIHPSIISWTMNALNKKVKIFSTQPEIK